MIQYDKKSCVARISNCAQEPFSAQPGSLSHTDSKYFCGDCFEGYFWNPE